jgi:hydroxypyruvate isomerase
VQVLINTFPGKNFGFAARKGEEAQFMESLQLSVDYCKALDCKLLHIMW